MQFSRLNEKSNKQIIELYFDYIGESNLTRALEAFSSKMGFGILDVGCEFACNFEKWEEGYFGESGVEIFISEPLVEADFSRVVSENELLEGVVLATNKFKLNDELAENLISKLRNKLSE